MRAEFDATAKDLMDSNNRIFRRSRGVRVWNIIHTVGTSAALTAFLLFLHFTQPTTLLPTLLLLSFVFIWSAVLRMLILKAYFKDLLSGQRCLHVVVELAPAGVELLQSGVRSFYEWRLIRDIRERKNSIEFLYDPIGLMIVRKKAFQTEEDVRKFFHEALRLWHDAKELSTGAGRD